MSQPDDAGAPAASDDPRSPPGISSGEARLLRIRRLSGLTLAPLSFIVVLLLPLPSLQQPAHRLAAVLSAIIVLWITEAVPLPLTALIGAAACVLLQVASAK